MENINPILENFILQSKTNNLKVLNYPKVFADLKMKVSFGQGVPARVSWISFLAQEMQTSNGFYPVYLFYKNENKLILAYGVSETSEYPITWPSEITNNNKRIKDYLNNPPRYGDSFLFKSYSIEINNSKVSFQSNDKKIQTSENLIKDLNEIIKVYKNSISLEIKDETSVVNRGLFFMEKQLEDFIIENWETTEFGKRYELLIEDGEVISQQYQTDIGKIDILAKDKITKNYVVIELKKNQTSDDTVGQLTRYMGWIRKNKKDENVKGIIVAGQFDNKLEYARTMVPNTEVFLYEVDFKLKEYK